MVVFDRRDPPLFLIGVGLSILVITIVSFGIGIFSSIIYAYAIKRSLPRSQAGGWLQLWNMGLCIILIILHPWMLIPTIIMFAIAFLWLYYRGVPKRLGFWE